MSQANDTVTRARSSRAGRLDVVAEFNRAKIKRRLGMSDGGAVLCIGPENRYELTALIGSGGMGTVFKARDTIVGRDLAIKVLKNTLLDDAGARELLLREARLLAGVRHENVVVVFDVGSSSWHEYFIAMDYVPGNQTLRTWRAARNPAVAAIVAAYRKAGAGLWATHRAGLVHRDFKPDNVFVADNGAKVVVGDFGLAQAVWRELESTVETQPHRVANDTRKSLTGGTPGYMAPELRSEYHAADYRSDQYSFCASLWEAVTDELPSDAGLVRPPWMPIWLFRMLRRGLSASPGDRFPDMGELLAALDRGVRLQRLTRPVLGGVVTLAILGVLVRAWLPDPCADAATAMNETWNAEARQQVDDALRGLELPHASSTAAYATQVLDDAALRWRSQARGLCEARDTLPESEFTQRQHCLERWHARMAERIEVLRHAEDRDADHILDLLEPLQAAENLCQTPPPILADSIEQRISESFLQESRANREGALDAANEAVELARASPRRCRDDAAYSFELGAALARQGEALARQQDYDAALVALQESLRHTLACGDDRLFIDTQIFMARVLATALSDGAGARLALDEASAMLSRTGAPLRGHRRAQLDKAEGKIAIALGDTVGARRHFEDGLARLDDIDGGDLLLATELQTSIADAYYFEGDYEAADAAYRSAAQRIRAVLGDAHPLTLERIAQANVSLGLAAYARGDFEQANESFSAVAEGSCAWLLIKAHTGLILTEVQADEPSPRLPGLVDRLLEVWRRHPSADRFTAAEVQATVGQAWVFMGNPGGIEMLEQARAAYRELGDTQNIVNTTLVLADAKCQLRRFEACARDLDEIRDVDFELDPIARDQFEKLDLIVGSATKQVANPPD